MKDIVLQRAQTDYNSNIVAINYDLIKNIKIDKSRVYFYFNPKELIEVNNYRENIYYILGLHSINFQYWDYSALGFHRYSKNDKIGAVAAYEGYDNLYTSLVKEKKQISNFLVNDLFPFFGNIPEKHARLINLQESLDRTKFSLAYRVILEDVEKNNLIDTVTAQKIADILPSSYSDPYLKKIQLALFEVHELLKIKYPRLEMDLTIAADYQIPKVLEAMGVLIYSSDLKNKIENHTLIEVDSPEERAIRAASILAAEDIVKQHNVSIPYLDTYLWENRNQFGNFKFHLTKTTRY